MLCPIHTEHLLHARLASYMNVRRFFMPKTGGKEDIPVVSFPYYHVCSKGTCKFLFDMRD